MSFIFTEDKMKAVKVIIAGPGGVGKTTLLGRYSTNKYIPGKTTVGVNFLVRDEDVGDGVLRISYWDYAGEDRFKVLFPAYSIGSSGALIAFDTSRIQTLDELIDWLTIIREKNADDIPVILLGLKIDTLTKEEREVVDEMANNFQEKYHLDGYYPCSSKTGEGVSEPFSHLAILIMDRLSSKLRK